MPKILHIYPMGDSKFCWLDHPYNKRFVDWVSGGIRPTSYRHYNGDTRKWSVHMKRLHLVVAMGRKHFDHVDYSELPEPIQIQIVKWLEDLKRSGSVMAPLAVGPHAVLFVLETAPWEVVKAAYKALALMAHPDQGGSDEDFRRIHEAYKELKDATKG